MMPMVIIAKVPDSAPSTMCIGNLVRAIFNPDSSQSIMVSPNMMSTMLYITYMVFLFSSVEGDGM